MFIKQFRHWHGPCKEPAVFAFLPSLHLLTRPRQLAVLAFAALLAPATHGQITLTLDDAVRLALERNPQIKVEAFGQSIARADLLTAYGRFDPALTFRRSYSEFSSLAPSNVIIADHPDG